MNVDLRSVAVLKAAWYRRKKYEFFEYAQWCTSQGICESEAFRLWRSVDLRGYEISEYGSFFK